MTRDEIEKAKKRDLKRLLDLEPTLSPKEFQEEVERTVRTWMLEGLIEPSEDFMQQQKN